ncbi:MAG: phosphotransferase, partial [Candidatus Sericytochromatia bacterium]
PPAAEPLPHRREASSLSVGSLLALLPWLEERRGHLAPLLPAMPHGLIHGDWIKRNMFWRGDEVASVIDFDLWNVAPLAFDLALALLPAGFDWPRVLAGDAEPNRPVLQAMREGYEAIRPLTPAERQGLPWLIETARFEFYLSAIHAALGRGAPEEADRFFELLLATTRWFSLHPAASRSFFA